MTNTLKRLHVVATFCGLCVAVLIGTTVRTQGQDESPAGQFTSDPTDAATCKANLNKIYEAIQEYRSKYKQLPKWLSDLHPEFVDDPKIFVCPFVQRKGDFQSWRAGLRDEVFLDPRLTISYGYEFCWREYPLWAGLSTTVQEYKHRQMSVIGSEVPIVRCFAHRPILNLSFGGKFFVSGKEWEENFTNVVAIEELLPKHLFKDRAPEPGRPWDRIPPHVPEAAARFVDLSTNYLAPLAKQWVFGNPPGNDLANLPQGILKFPAIGIEFDVRGLIQLKAPRFSAPFPEKVEGIQVHQRCKRIHFLHGTVFKAKLDTEIGSYDVHYADGQRRSIPIVYGRDLLEWWFDPKLPKSGTARVAWEGVNQASKTQGMLIRLYHSQWENPLKDTGIATISFHSAMADSAPFLIAITLE